MPGRAGHRVPNLAETAVPSGTRSETWPYLAAQCRRLHERVRAVYGARKRWLEVFRRGLLVQFLEAEEELVQRTLGRSDAAVIGDLSNDWRLERISLSRLDPELGISYQATFRASGRLRGPSCTFTMVGGEIQIVSVGYWMA